MNLKWGLYFGSLTQVVKRNSQEIELSLLFFLNYCLILIHVFCMTILLILIEFLLNREIINNSEYVCGTEDGAEELKTGCCSKCD